MMAVTYETIGLLVYREMASFALVQELAGGLTVVMWRKLQTWVATVRHEQDHPRFAEWFQRIISSVSSVSPFAV